MAPRLIFIVGPTASGKSDLALRVAPALSAEIISADSMQVYRRLDIGTAKPSLEIQKAIPHHLIDIRDLSEEFSVFEYVEEFRKIIQSPRSADKTFVVVGGTGLYIKGLLRGISRKPGADPEVRKRLEAEGQRDGIAVLRARLERIDPEYAKIVQDTRRIVRALEVYELSAKTVTEWNQETRGLVDEGYQIKIYGLEWPRELLKARITERSKKMIDQGLVEEVSRLKDEKWSKTARQAIGYRETLEFLGGALERAKLADEISRNTQSFAKRQMTWFRKEKLIGWIRLETESSLEEISDRILSQ